MKVWLIIVVHSEITFYFHVVYTRSTFLESRLSRLWKLQALKATVMSGIKARKWLNKKPFQGLPKRDDFEITEEELPAMKDGGTT